jgi:hypothetical protein
MFYWVRARLKKEAAAEFLGKLLDGRIADQRPDGSEIVDSMKRAVVSDSGDIEWSEVCYCPTPLAHERRTVYDHHLDDLTTEVVDGYQEQTGRPFMEYLEEVAEASAK